MDLSDLRAACTHPGKDYVQLVLPRAMGRGERMRLAGPGSPTGRVVGEVGPKRTMVDFRAADVLAWLDSVGPTVPERPRPDG